MKNKEKNGLSIIIVGCGKVGAALTEQLYREGHDITVVDKNAEAVSALSDAFDVMGIVGNGASYSVQMEAGINDADLLIAVTGSDELNLLCCTVAKRVGNCSSIARVRTPDYSNEVGYLCEKLGLSMIINPELEAANEIARILYLPTALSVSPFTGGSAELVRFKLPAGNSLCGQKLSNLGKNLAKNILICAIERENDVYIPGGSFELREGDVISFISSAQSAASFFDKAGFQTGRVRDIMIIGGGKSAYYLAKQLLTMGITVTIIESDRDRCEELVSLLPDAIIVNGNGTDEDLLKEAGIDRTDAFVPLTGIDEENILLTLYAKGVSDAKVITKINHINFHGVINDLELGSLVYPSYITAETIVAYVRAKKNSIDSNIETLYHMYESRVEAIEFRVGSIPGLTDVPLRELKTMDNLLVACINRNGRTIIPGGEDCIKNGDSVVIVTTHSGFHDISDILQ